MQRRGETLAHGSSASRLLGWKKWVWSWDSKGGMGRECLADEGTEAALLLGLFAGEGRLVGVGLCQVSWVERSGIQSLRELG